MAEDCKHDGGTGYRPSQPGKTLCLLCGAHIPTPPHIAEQPSTRVVNDISELIR